MLQFPLWKKILIWGLCLLGVVLASPNLNYSTVEAHNDAVKLQSDDKPFDQADMDGWPSFLPNALVNLGLDLRGGAHLLAEVAVADAYTSRMDAMWPSVRDALREDSDTLGTIRRADSAADELRVRLGNVEAMSVGRELVEALSQPVSSLTGTIARDIEVAVDGNELIVTLSEAERREMDRRTMEQTVEIVRRRVDEAGTREPTIQRQGEDRVLIQVPGLGSAEELKTLLGTTAKLSFHHVEGLADSIDAPPGARNMILPDVEDTSAFYRVKRSATITGEELTDAQPAFDQNGAPAVNFRLNPSGGRKFGQYTADNIGNLFAIVLDGEVISAPRIQSHIPGGSGIITGNFTVESSTQLSILLRAGALPAELTYLEERTIGPELGQDSIEAGRLACLVAFGAVLVFMVLAYGRFGLFADVALLVNVALIFGLLSIMGATLTLPGIAGIVLTIGMAVDANVLVFERIREELKTAKGPARAIELGYEKAFSAIIDANITTFIAAVILFIMGSGPVRGFSVTLGLGIMTSVFTAIYVTRLMISMWFDYKRPKTIDL